MPITAKDLELEIPDEITTIADLLTAVCGMNENWAKTCVYYCMATHELSKIRWMPILDVVGMQGTGKSNTVHVLRAICYKPYDIVGHSRMTAATLRNELVKAEDATAVIEEGDLFPNRRELESYLINRTARDTTSRIAVTHLVEIKGVHVWKTDTFGAFGATIVHDRNEMVDLAAERRSIVVNTRKQKGKAFRKVEKNDPILKTLHLPPFSLGQVPAMFKDVTGSALDAFEPMIRIADNVGDHDWLAWAHRRICDMTERLEDSQQWEQEQMIFSALIRAYADRTGMGLMDSDIRNSPLPLQSVTDILNPLGKPAQYHPKTVATELRKMGFKDIRKVGGQSKIYSVTLDQLKGIAEELGYEDEKI